MQSGNIITKRVEKAQLQSTFGERNCKTRLDNTQNALRDDAIAKCILGNAIIKHALGNANANRVSKSRDSKTRYQKETRL